MIIKKLLSTALVITVIIPPSTAAIIPDTRLTDWNTAGVIGGIPNRTTVCANVAAGGSIQNAIDSSTCAGGGVVQLAGGTYSGAFRFDKNSPKSNITVRGAADGTTVIDVGGGNIILGVGGGGWPWDRNSGNALTGTALKGTKTVPASTAGIAVNDIVLLTQDADLSLPVIRKTGFGSRDQLFMSRVAGTTGGLTLEDNMPTDFTTTLTAKVRKATDGFVKNCGIENVKLKGSGQRVLLLYNAYNCWVKKVKIEWTGNYALDLMQAVHCEIRKCEFIGPGSSGNNHGGIIIGTPGSYSIGGFSNLIVDSIFRKSFPHIEISIGSAKNVIAYNLFEDSEAVGGVFGTSIDWHGPHPSWNLIEGNIFPKLQQDSYFGSASNETIFRNRITGVFSRSKQGASSYLSQCVDIGALSRKFNVVGNVLGMAKSVWGDTNSVDEKTTSEDGRAALYRFGYPNMGSMGYSATAQPSAGDNWASWGQSGGDGDKSYQERDLDVKPSTLLKANYSMQTNSIPADQALGTGESLPDSLFLTSKPGWFGTTLKWPVDWAKTGSSISALQSEYILIPAGYRDVYGQDPPGVTDTNPPAQTPHPADTNSDFLMGLNEATKYGACWKNPATYPDCPSNPAIEYAVRAGTLWNASANGQYQFNSVLSCPLCWEVKP